MKQRHQHAVVGGGAASAPLRRGCGLKLLVRWRGRGRRVGASAPLRRGCGLKLIQFHSAALNVAGFSPSSEGLRIETRKRVGTSIITGGLQPLFGGAAD